MSQKDCGPGGRTPDGLTTQVDESTTQNTRQNTPNDELTLPNVCDKPFRTERRFLDGIPLVKEKLCGMWNAIVAYTRWRSDHATIDAASKGTGSKSISLNNKTSGDLEILIERPRKTDISVGDAHGAENIIARRSLVANQTISALAALASYAWICTFIGWMVSEMLAAVCRMEMPEIGWLLDVDQDLYRFYINQSSMKLQTLVVTIVPPLYLISWVLVAIWFTNVILFSTGFKSFTPPVSSIPSAIPTPIVPTAWASRVMAWTTNVAARSAAFIWWARIHLFVFWILFALSTWSYGVTVTIDPGFLPENEWPYTGDPFGDDHFLPHHTSSIFEVPRRSHPSGTSRVFDSGNTLDSTLGSFHPIAISHRSVDMNGNADRMINMKARYLWAWDDEETRLWVAKQWEGSGSSANNEKAAEHDKSVSKSFRRSKPKKLPKGTTTISHENGVSNFLDGDMVTTNTRTARVLNPFHNSLDKESSDPDIEGEMSDVGISLNFGADKDVRDASREDKKTEFNHKQVNYTSTGKRGEFTESHLSLYDQRMLYMMAVSHYFDTAFLDNERMLASGIPEPSGFTNYIYLTSTAYVAGDASTGYINSAGHGSAEHMNDPADYIHHHGGTQSVAYDSGRYVQNPIKPERMRPIQYNRTRIIQYDPFRRIFVPYGAKYSGICDKYVVGLQTYPPLMMRWINGFIGNPIGFRNQKAFSLFLLYTGMLSCYVLLVLGGKMLGLIWNLKSVALIEAKESKSLEEGLNSGLLQKSSGKEQMGPETNEGLTKTYTKNEVNISISGRESNIVDNNYMTTFAEVAFDTTSTTVSLKIKQVLKSHYLNLVVLGWCLLHSVCAVSMMQDGLWNGQHGIWDALNDGTGSPYIGNVHNIVCSFLPHEACLERNTIRDYVMANKGAAFAEIQDPNIEYPSSDSNRTYTSSQRVSIAQSFLQRTSQKNGMPIDAWPISEAKQMQADFVEQQPEFEDTSRYAGPMSGTVIFEGTALDKSTCRIETDGENNQALRKAFNKLHLHCRSVLDVQGKMSLRPDILKRIFENPEIGGQNMLGTQNDKFQFKPLGIGGMGGVYRFLKPRNCKQFVVKVQGVPAHCSFEACLREKEVRLRLEFLRSSNPEFLLVPRPPKIEFSGVGDVLFMPYVSGDEVFEKLSVEYAKPDWFYTFFRSLVPLMFIIDDMMFPKFLSPGLLHRDIKLQNMMFTSESSRNAFVGLIDWDLLVEEGLPWGPAGTPHYIPCSWQSDGNSFSIAPKPNDEFALMESAALVMLGNVLPPLNSRQGCADPDSLRRQLYDAASQHSHLFPRVQWGTQINDHRFKEYFQAWSNFLQSYFSLWVLPSQPDLSCFANVHTELAFGKIYKDEMDPSLEGTLYCGEHWNSVHVNLRRIVAMHDEFWEVPQYNSKFRGVLMPLKWHETFVEFIKAWSCCYVERLSELRDAIWESVRVVAEGGCR